MSVSPSAQPPERLCPRCSTIAAVLAGVALMLVAFGDQIDERLPAPPPVPGS